MGRVIGLVFTDEAKAPLVNLKTKAEIKAYLDEIGIEYPSDATVAELKALLPED